ncbi:sugar nucleotide-binding protein [Rhodococcus hoagii]|nr:sugar nucleotide-binding protein [Prescottella equi]
MRALVLGGYGAVGASLVRHLRAAGIESSAAGRDAARADVQLDLADTGALEAAARAVDVVVNASGRENADVARAAVRAGAVFVDITATTSYSRELERIEGPVLLGVGLAPGLTGLLASEVAATGAGPVEILVGIGAGERHGAAAAEWTYRLLGERFDDPDGSPVRNFTRPQSISLPPAVSSEYRAFPAVRADFADQHVLTAGLGVPVRTYLRMDSRIATLGLATLTWVPALRSSAPTRMWGSDRWIALARNADGASRWATGRGQSEGTAAITAWAVARLAERPIARPTWLHDNATLAELRSSSAADAIEFGAVDGATR